MDNPRLEDYKLENEYLKGENKILNDLVSYLRRENKKSQSTNAKLKGDLIIFETQKKNAEENSRTKDKEYDKLLKEYTKMKTQVQRATVEGLETDALRKKILTDKFKQIEDDHLFLAGKDKNGDILKFQFIKYVT